MLLICLCHFSQFGKKACLPPYYYFGSVDFLVLALVPDCLRDHQPRQNHPMMNLDLNLPDDSKAIDLVADEGYLSFHYHQSLVVAVGVD